MGEQSFYIYSGEHNAYWRPESRGYTTKLEEAGRYTLSEAHRKTNHCGPEKHIKIGVFPPNLQGIPAQ
jgi:hypothetical protein